MCLGVDSSLLWIVDHHSFLLNLLRQRRVIYALFPANELEATHRGASPPAGIVDGVDAILECLDVINVALILSLGAQVELGDVPAPPLLACLAWCRPAYDGARTMTSTA